jgi:predicted RNA binding protein YcfA (HicA-like mRNA interferase family)
VSRHFPVCNAAEVARVLRRAGFILIAQRGSHQKWRHTDGRQVIVPVHGGKPIPPSAR